VIVNPDNENEHRNPNSMSPAPVVVAAKYNETNNNSESIRKEGILHDTTPPSSPSPPTTTTPTTPPSITDLTWSPIEIPDTGAFLSTNTTTAPSPNQALFLLSALPVVDTEAGSIENTKKKKYLTTNRRKSANQNLIRDNNISNVTICSRLRKTRTITATTTP